MEKVEEPIRILQCVSNMDRAGIETMLMNFYRRIDRKKIQFDFLVNKSKPGAYDEEIKKLGGKIYISPGLNPIKFIKYQKFIDELFHEHKEYKIIHCQNESMGYYALYGAKRNNIPVRISHSHNTTLPVDYKFLIKKFCNRKIKNVANIYVACGTEAGKFMFKKDFKVIKNAIDTKKFIFNNETRNKIRKQLNIEDKFVIGHIGRFEQQKNHKFIIELFECLHKKDNNSVLLLAGDGSLMEKTKNLVKEKKLNDNVIFTGNISNVNELYQAMDVFILPSLHEGLPVVGIEAQTADLPCVFSTNITKEVKLLDRVNFIDLTDKDKWINTILSYKNSKRKDNSKNIIKCGYDIEAATKELQDWYIKLYKEVKNNEECSTNGF